MDVQALDGRFITLVGSQTQTDREGVEQNLSFSCQVQKDVGEHQVLQAEMNTDSVVVFLKEAEDGTTSEKQPYVALPRLIALRPEQLPLVQTEGLTESTAWPPEAESKKNVLVECDYCQQLCPPFTFNEPLKNKTHSERFYCCEQYQQVKERLWEYEEKLIQKKSARRYEECHGAISSKKKVTDKESGRRRLNQHWKNSTKDTFNAILHHPKSHTIIFKWSEVMREELGTDGMEMNKIIQKLYKNGKCFSTLYPDGTGKVLYPSGNAAIVISSEDADFTYKIFEDKYEEASIKGIFSTKGHSTCYHPNGQIWLNTTPSGGLFVSETGDQRRCWKWLYFDQNVHELPFLPLIFILVPHISVRIYSKERMYVTFAHKTNTVRFNVGSRLELICQESHDQSDQDMLG